VLALSRVPPSDFAHKMLSWQRLPLHVGGRVGYQCCRQTWDFCVPVFLLSNRGTDDLPGMGKTKTLNIFGLLTINLSISVLVKTGSYTKTPYVVPLGV